MRASPQKKSFDQACQMCGTRIPLHQRAQSNELFCCEACYLQSHTTRLGHAASIQSDVALAGALGLREHEAGLHSKRVACHTLELARFCIPGEAERLRQIYWGGLCCTISASWAFRTQSC